MSLEEGAWVAGGAMNCSMSAICNHDKPGSGIHPGTVTYWPYTYHRGGMGREQTNTLKALAMIGNDTQT